MRPLPSSEVWNTTVPRDAGGQTCRGGRRHLPPRPSTIGLETRSRLAERSTPRLHEQRQAASSRHSRYASCLTPFAPCRAVLGPQSVRQLPQRIRPPALRRGSRRCAPDSAPIVETGKATCSRCLEMIEPGSECQLDHRDDDRGHLGPSNASCNARARAEKLLGLNGNGVHPETPLKWSRRWYDDPPVGTEVFLGDGLVEVARSTRPRKSYADLLPPESSRCNRSSSSPISCAS